VQIIERETCQTVEPARTRFIPPDEFAAYCDCSLRAVQYGLSELRSKGVIESVQESVKGTSYRVAYEKWPDLIAQPEVIEAEPADEEPEDKKPVVRLVVIDKWKRVSPGGRTKATFLPKPVSSFRIRSIDGILFRSQLVDDVLEVEIRGEDGANPKPKPPNMERDGGDGFENFESAWLARNINAGINDWAEARKIWAHMDTSERLRAVQGVHTRFECGEFDLKDPKWIPLPQNYLNNQFWMRPLRPKTRSKEDEFKLKMQAGLARARARDEAERRNSK
jgi:hypothetical protein